MALLERNPHDQAVCRCGDRVGVHAMVHPHFSSENEECIGWMEQGDESFED